VILVFFLGINYCFYSEINVLAQTDQANSELQTANKALDQAFNAVLNAEKAGGNVTLLLAKLDTVGNILADAQNALNSVNPTNITSKLENAYQMANQINDEALNLRNVSLIESQNSFWVTLIFSVVGAVGFGISLLLAWQRFKHAFIKKLLEAKPEVVENES
jgi:CHASE3 domain sensor protein